MSAEREVTKEELQGELALSQRRENILSQRIGAVERQLADALARNEVAVQREKQSQERTETLIQENEELQKENKLLKHDESKENKKTEKA